MPKAGSSPCSARSCRSTSRDALPRPLRHAIDRQRQPEGYVGHLEARGRTPAQTRLRRHFLRFARIRRGQCVLEVGSGTGIVTRDAARLVGPRGQMVGVDPSHVMTHAARRLARRAGFFGPRLVHAVGTGARLRFPPDRFDCVFAVTVLFHVRNSEAILREMVRVTRAGGMVAVQDQDFGALALDHPDRDLTQRIMDGVVSRMYSDPFSGRTLYGWLVRLGLRDVRLAVEVFQDTRLEPYTRAMLSRRAENAVKLGIAAPRAAARWLAAVERLAAIGQFAFTLNYYATRGVKP